jgi:hypothetical protein
MASHAAVCLQRRKFFRSVTHSEFRENDSTSTAPLKLHDVVAFGGIWFVPILSGQKNEELRISDKIWDSVKAT